MSECSQCNSVGSYVCPTCNGGGQHLAVGQNGPVSRECLSCGGTGRIRCDNCDAALLAEGGARSKFPTDFYLPRNERHRIALVAMFMSVAALAFGSLGVMFLLQSSRTSPGPARDSETSQLSGGQSWEASWRI